MTEPLFAKLRELEKKATGIEWFHKGSLSEEEACKAGGIEPGLCALIEEEDGRFEEQDLLDPLTDTDAEFIAEMRNSLPKLFAALDLMEDALKTIKFHEDPRFMFSFQYSIVANALAKVREMGNG